MRIRCRCFNIVLNVYDDCLKPIDLKCLKVFGAECDDDFFAHGVSPVSLAQNGVKEVVPYLIRKYAVGEWEIVACMNCETPVYGINAFQSVDNQLVVNCKLPVDDGSDNDQVDGGSFEFSPAFQISLDPSSHLLGSDEDTTYGVEIPKHSRLQPALTLLNDYMSKYVNRQTSDMEDRIRAFIESEKLKLLSEKKRAQRDKMLLVGKLRRLEEEYGDLSYVRRPRGGHDDNLGYMDVNTGLLEMSDVVPGGDGGSGVVVSGARSSTASSGGMSGSASSGSEGEGESGPAMFDMDDVSMLLYDPVEPDTGHRNTDTESGSDDSQDDDDETTPHASNQHIVGIQMVGMSGRVQRGQTARGTSHDKVARSLPVCVPGQWMSERPPLTLAGQQEEEEEEREGEARCYPPGPDIGASIQAIAQSLHGDNDTTSMFGARPRPRFNTMNTNRR